MIQTRTFSILVRRNRRSRLLQIKKWLWTKTETLHCCCTPSLLVGKIILHCYADEPLVLHFIQLKLIKTKNVNKASACADATVTYL